MLPQQLPLVGVVSCSLLLYMILRRVRLRRGKKAEEEEEIWQTEAAAMML